MLKVLRRIRKFQKAALRFVMSVPRPHGTIGPPLDGFSWNLKFEDFSKIHREYQVSLISDTNNGYFTHARVLMIYLLVLVTMRCFRQKL